jgi:Ca-activated chloride channel family protein
LLPNLVPRRPGRLRYVPLALLLLALTAMIVGAARPHTHLSIPRKEATVVLAIDISRSMTAKDVKPSRLDAARAAGDAFLAKVPSTYNVALVAFGSRAFVAVPATTDHALVRTGLAGLTSGEGTALGDAIVLAAQMGQRQKAREGVVPPTTVLLISDGAREGGRTPPLTAAKRAKALGVTVSTVLVGTPSGIVTTPLVGGYQEQIRVPPSPGTLQAIARTTGGEFFRARTSTALNRVYEHLATRVGHRVVDREITDIFAGGSIVVLLVSGALSMLWFRRVL